MELLDALFSEEKGPPAPDPWPHLLAPLWRLVGGYAGDFWDLCDLAGTGLRLVAEAQHWLGLWGPDSYWLGGAVVRAAAADDLQWLRWFDAEIGWGSGVEVGSLRAEAFLAACASGRLEPAQSALPVSATVAHGGFHVALTQGHLGIAQWVAEWADVPLNRAWATLQDACRAGRLPAVRWLLEYKPELARQPLSGLINRAAYGRHLELCAWLAARPAFASDTPLTWKRETMVRVGGSGDLELLRWCAARGMLSPDAWRGAFGGACSAGHVHAASWIAERGNVGGEKFLATACVQGRPNVVGWLTAKFGASSNEVVEALVRTMAWTHFTPERHQWLVRWLMDRLGPDWECDVPDRRRLVCAAFLSDQTDVAEWVADRLGWAPDALSDPSPVAVLGRCCQHGSQNTAQWLWARLSLEHAACLPLADLAADRGHARMLGWLVAEHDYSAEAVPLLARACRARGACCAGRPGTRCGDCRRRARSAARVAADHFGLSLSGAWASCETEAAGDAGDAPVSSQDESKADA